MSYMSTCDDCGCEFDPREKGTGHQVTGWVIDRTEQGLKANSVHEKTFTGIVRCPACTALRRLGLSPSQQAMFR